MTSCKDCHPLANRPVVTALDLTKLGPRLDVAARRYLGVPFLHQGRNPAIGIDCVGLLVLAARDCGLNDLAAHDLTSYARNPAKGELERRLRAALSPVSEPIPGDVVSISYHGQTRHVAIVGERNGRLTLIHTASNVGRVVEHGLTDQWRSRITGIYRVEDSL